MNDDDFIEMEKRAFDVLDKLTKPDRDRFKKYFPKTDDITLIVLKGHLLLEEQLNGLVEVMVRSPEVLFQGERLFTFYQKIRLVESLLGKSNTNSDSIWLNIEKINEIRNKLAHKLDIPELEDKIDKFINPRSEPFRCKSSEERIEKLEERFFIIHSILSSMKHTLSIVNKKK